MRLENRIALITAGGKGIGRSIAIAFAREGADLPLCARTESDLKNTAAEIERMRAMTFFARPTSPKRPMPWRWSMPRCAIWPY